MLQRCLAFTMLWAAQVCCTFFSMHWKMLSRCVTIGSHSRLSCELSARSLVTDLMWSLSSSALASPQRTSCEGCKYSFWIGDGNQSSLLPSFGFVRFPFSVISGSDDLAKAIGSALRSEQREVMTLWTCSLSDTLGECARWLEGCFCHEKSVAFEEVVC